MAYIKFIRKKNVIQASVRQIWDNVVRITTPTEAVLSGFRMYLDEECKYPMDNGEYESYTTLYSQGDGWYELSNDGSVYTEPVAPEVVEPTETEMRIAEINFEIADLKKQLDSSDYKISKTYEYSLVGKESEYDIKELHNERQAMRDRINELQIELSLLV